MTGARGALERLRAFSRSHPHLVTAAGTILVTGALAVALASHRDEFATALGAASVWMLIGVSVLQVAWLAIRSETWNVCVNAAGGNAGRRRLYRCASFGYVGNLLNGQFGLAVRIGALRRCAPDHSPKAPVLLATEVPIVVVEAALAAIMSFTLVGPLGLAWWAPLVMFAVVGLVLYGFGRLAHNRSHGFWRGFAVLRGMNGRNTVTALVIAAVGIQIARNWLVLNAVGVDASVFDAVALLIAMAVLGVLPVGPTVGAASAAIVFGSNAAAAAAAGALLTATAAFAALAFAALMFVVYWVRGPAPLSRPVTPRAAAPV